MEKTQLITVAETLNEILGLDPEIPTKGKKVTVEMLTEKINEAVDLLVEDDKLPEEVREILSEMHPDNELFAAPESDSEEDVEDEGGEDEVEDEAGEAEADAEETEVEAGEDADSSEETDDEATDAVEKPKKGKGKKGKGKSKKEKVAKEPKPKKEKVKKEPVVREPSAFGVATNILCKNPDMPYADLKEAVRQEIGSDAKMTAISTAYSSVRKVVRLLRENKLMK